MYRRFKTLQIRAARNSDGTKAREMFRQELRVEQHKTTPSQPRNEMNQSNLAGVAFAREHAFAEEGSAEIHTIEAAGQPAVAPAFNAVGIPAPV